jgi:restriction endonuclease S subunit
MFCSLKVAIGTSSAVALSGAAKSRGASIKITSSACGPTNVPVLLEFLCAVISSPVGKSYFQQASKQTTNLASINQRQLRAFQVALPPLREQHRIVAQFERAHTELNAFQKMQTEVLAKVDALLPAILDRAFKGEL